jgi:hypothetical protein
MTAPHLPVTGFNPDASVDTFISHHGGQQYSAKRKFMQR